MKRMVLAMAAVAVFLFAPVAARQQSPPPQPAPRFKAGVDLVAIDVSVLDADRRPLRGLTAQDFTVLENGRPQPIKTFTAVDLPDAVEETPVASWVRDVQPDVARNDTLSNRRIVVLVLDDATPMPAEDVPRAKTTARRVVEELGSGDLAAVVYTFNKRAGQEFTTDRARLLAAVDRFNGTFDKDAVLGPYNADPALQTNRTTSFDEFNPAALTLYTSVVETLRTLAEYLVDLPERRKSLIFVSVGLPLDVEAAAPKLISMEGMNADMTGGAQLLFNGLGKAFAAAQKANVNIYSIDPGGLRPSAARYDAMAGSGTLAANPGNLNRDFLHAVAASTGGFAVTNTNEVEQGVAQIFRENASYYLLGYEPPAPRAPGRFRRIEVRVNRPDVTVRARNGYYEAPDAKAVKEKDQPRPVDKALAAFMPKADLALQAAAAPFALSKGKDAAVAITLAVRQELPESTERIVNEITAQVSAYDDAGKRRAADSAQARLVLRAGSGGEVVLELASRLDLAPGHYQLRLAADSSVQSKSGSVYCDLDVPDFHRAALSMSGIILSATPGAPAARKEAIASLLPLVPTALRDFDARQHVTAFVRVYTGGSAGNGRAELATRIRNDADDVVFEQTAHVEPNQLTADGAFELRVDLPVADLKPGRHLLTIEATRDKETIRKDVRFQVR